MNKVVKEKIKEGVTLVLIIIAFSSALWIMLKYNSEGEKNMPFDLSKILIISSAETQEKEENPEEKKWNVNINQYNDFYIEFVKNENKKETDFIKSITIEDVNFSNPTKGKVFMYMPSSTDGKTFEYENSFMVTNSLKYNGGNEDNTKTLTIGNQGGTILFRIVNKNISEYVSEEDDEIKLDGSLLSKTNVTLEEVKFTISFDVKIETLNNTYIGNISLELPVGDITTEGVCKKNITNVVFKRI